MQGNLLRSLGSAACVHAVVMVTELGLQAPASELPTVTMKPGSVSAFVPYPSFPFTPRFPLSATFSVPEKVALSLKHQKGTGVTPHPLWGLRLNKIMGVEGQRAQRNLLRAGSTIYGHLRRVWLGPKDQAVFYWRLCAFFCCW